MFSYISLYIWLGLVSALIWSQKFGNIYLNFHLCPFSEINWIDIVFYSLIYNWVQNVVYIQMDIFLLQKRIPTVVAENLFFDDMIKYLMYSKR